MSRKMEYMSRRLAKCAGQEVHRSVCAGKMRCPEECGLYMGRPRCRARGSLRLMEGGDGYEPEGGDGSANVWAEALQQGEEELLGSN